MYKIPQKSTFACQQLGISPVSPGGGDEGVECEELQRHNFAETKILFFPPVGRNRNIDFLIFLLKNPVIVILKLQKNPVGPLKGQISFKGGASSIL